MKKTKIFILLLIFIFPLIVNAGGKTEELDTPINLDFIGKSEPGYGVDFIRTHPTQFYSINGQIAYCMDQDTPNPKKLYERTVYTVGDSSFTDGLLAMLNYNIERNYAGGLYDAIRVFTAERLPKKIRGYNRYEIGSGDHVTEVKKFLAIADAAADNGDTTYLPTSGSSEDIDDNFSLEVVDDSNIGNIRVRIVFSGNKPSNFKMAKTCTTSSSSVECKITSTLNSNNEFTLSLTGKSNNGSVVTVKINFSGGSSKEMYDKVYIYECNRSQQECDSIGLSLDNGYQRFLTIDGDKVPGGGGCTYLCLNLSPEEFI